MKSGHFYRFILSLTALLCLGPVFCQQKAKETSQRLGLQLSLPVGAFSQSHNWGTGLQYQLAAPLPAWLRAGDRMQWRADLAAHYYHGKSTVADGYPFRFSNYYRVDLSAGLQYDWTAIGQWALLAGPSATYYGGNYRLGWNAQAGFQRPLTEKLAVGPAIAWGKTARTESLWALRLQASYRLGH